MIIRFDKSLSLYDIARAARFIGCRLVHNGTGEIVVKPKSQYSKTNPKRQRHLHLVVSNG